MTYVYQGDSGQFNHLMPQLPPFLRMFTAALYLRQDYFGEIFSQHYSRYRLRLTVGLKNSPSVLGFCKARFIKGSLVASNME